MGRSRCLAGNDINMLCSSNRGDHHRNALQEPVGRRRSDQIGRHDSDPNTRIESQPAQQMGEYEYGSNKNQLPYLDTDIEEQ